MQSSGPRIPRKDSLPAWEFRASTGKFPEMTNPSNSESFLLSHKGKVGKAEPGLQCWHLGMLPWEVMGKGCREREIQPAAPSTQGRRQRQLLEGVMATIIPPSSHHHPTVTLSHASTPAGQPPSCSRATRCNSSSRKGFICTQIDVFATESCSCPVLSAPGWEVITQG